MTTRSRPWPTTWPACARANSSLARQGRSRTGLFYGPDNPPMSSLPTTGLEVQRGSRAWRDTLELVSSMRFSISLLTVICIASMIGTVVRQHEPLPNYVNQFGPFWAEVFGAVGLYTVYSAGWFLLILGFLVLSTSLCIARNVPKIAADLRTFKEHVREQALPAF